MFNKIVSPLHILCRLIGLLTVAVISPTVTAAQDINAILPAENTRLSTWDTQLKRLETDLPTIGTKLRQERELFVAQKQTFQGLQTKVTPPNFAALNVAQSHTIQTYDLILQMLEKTPPTLAKERVAIKMMQNNSAVFRQILLSATPTTESKSNLLYLVANNLASIDGDLLSIAPFLQELDKFVSEQQISWLNNKNEIEQLKNQPPTEEMIQRINIQNRLLEAGGEALMKVRTYREAIIEIWKNLQVEYGTQRDLLTLSAAHQ